MPKTTPKCLACTNDAKRIGYGRFMAFCSEQCCIRWAEEEIDELYACCPTCGRWSVTSEWTPMRDQDADRCPNTSCNAVSTEDEREEMGSSRGGR